MDNTLVSFKNVNKSYDGKTLIIDNLSLDINKGEFVSLLGPSGSGKTTCLMMLAGFEPLTSGEILIDGSSINNIHPSKRNIGMVFQNYALFPHMTVYENLAFPLEIRKMAKGEIKNQVEKILSIVRLEGFALRRTSQLSGGQQQRVAVARAITFEPEIVLMDEPLGALDKNLREEMQFEIKHLHERLGITIVYVTHDQSEAITMSDRVAVFNDGTIQQYSTSPELYERPANAFVANFIGENNNLLGEVVKRNENTCWMKVQGAEISGYIDKATQLNGQALMSVRPEKVIVNPDKQDKLFNHVQGTVTEAIYMGDHIRICFKVLDNEEFIVKVLNNQETVQYKIGDVVDLGWNSQHCCVLEAG